MNYQKSIKTKGFLKTFLNIVVIGILSYLLMYMTFRFSSVSLNEVLVESYFQDRLLILMNFIPIFLLMGFLTLIFNRLWAGFAITSLIFYIISIVNKFKLIYRDEPLSFTDITLLSESFDMAGKYDILPDRNMILIFLVLAVITILLKIFINHRINSLKIRLSLIGIIVIISIIISNTIYFNSNVYAEVGDEELINIWSDSQQFQSRGLVYPFIYSVRDLKDRQLEGYDEKLAKNVIEEREYNNIAEKEKVNIISIMLESYNDFTKFDNVNISEEVYENFHKLQEESYSGNLITNVFGGGTTNTEWGFVTGYNSHPKYIKNTNSFVRYFNEQGYKTEAMHPGYGWFYNRRNINEYLGFDNFDYYENKYKSNEDKENEVEENALSDNEFFNYIIKGYKDSKKEGKPYFNFSVTYQNHGPYASSETVEKEHIKRDDNLDGEDFNIINNYLEGIRQTDEAIGKLINYYEKEDEPVVIILFGDHNPQLGEDSLGFEKLGINMDLSTTEGFINYYETPYIIWSNSAAKDVLNKDFKGEGSTISPNFIMAELFQYLDWKGNRYMDYIIDVKDNFDVNHDMYFKEDGEFTRKLSEKRKPIWEEFNYVQYYYSRNFRDNKNN